MYDKNLIIKFENDINKLNNELDILTFLLNKALEYTDSEGATVYLLENEKLSFYLMENKKLKIHSGFDGKKVNMAPVDLCITNACAYAAMTKNIVNIDDVYKDKTFIWTGPKNYDAKTGYKTKSVLVIPLSDKDENVFGVLQLLNTKRKIKGKRIYIVDDEDLIYDMGIIAKEAILNL